RKLEYVFKDLDCAKSSIVLSLPAHSSLTPDWTRQILNRKKEIKLIVVSPDDWSEIKPNQCISANIPFPFVLIDSKVLWLGMPLEAVKHVAPPYVAARI